MKKTNIDKLTKQQLVDLRNKIDDKLDQEDLPQEVIDDILSQSESLNEQHSFTIQMDQEIVIYPIPSKKKILVEFDMFDVDIPSDNVLMKNKKAKKIIHDLEKKHKKLIKTIQAAAKKYDTTVEDICDDLDIVFSE